MTEVLCLLREPLSGATRGTFLGGSHHFSSERMIGFIIVYSLGETGRQKRRSQIYGGEPGFRGKRTVTKFLGGDRNGRFSEFSEKVKGDFMGDESGNKYI